MLVLMKNSRFSNDNTKAKSYKRITCTHTNHNNDASIISIQSQFKAPPSPSTYLKTLAAVRYQTPQNYVQ